MSVSIDPSSPSYDRPTTEGSVWFREYEKHEEPQQKSQQIARIQKVNQNQYKFAEVYNIL